MNHVNFELRKRYLEGLFQILATVLRRTVVVNQSRIRVVIAPALFADLTVTKTHAGTWTQGQTGAPYTVTVRNIGTGATSGTVTVVDGSATPPEGVDLTPPVEAGAVLTDGNPANDLAAIPANITANDITFVAMSTGVGQLGYIPDGTNLPGPVFTATKTYTLKIYLKTALLGTLPTTIDGMAFGFEILTSGVTASGTGTGIKALQAQNSGADVVTVVATKLDFTTLAFLTAPTGRPSRRQTRRRRSLPRPILRLSWSSASSSANADSPQREASY
jgi:hypothetical protein